VTQKSDQTLFELEVMNLYVESLEFVMHACLAYGDSQDLLKFAGRNVTDGCAMGLKEGDMFAISSVSDFGFVTTRVAITYWKGKSSSLTIFGLLLSEPSSAASEERLLDIVLRDVCDVRAKSALMFVREGC
jgi:hypothetical protein